MKKLKKQKHIKFKNIILKFREFYHLNEFTLKQLDHYLWQVGIGNFKEKKEEDEKKKIIIKK